MSLAILELTSSVKRFGKLEFETIQNCLDIVWFNIYFSLILLCSCEKIFILEFFSRSGMTIRFIFHGVPYGGNKEQIPIRLKARAF